MSTDWFRHGDSDDEVLCAHLEVEEVPRSTVLLVNGAGARWHIYSRAEVCRDCSSARFLDVNLSLLSRLP